MTKHEKDFDDDLEDGLDSDSPQEYSELQLLEIKLHDIRRKISTIPDYKIVYSIIALIVAGFFTMLFVVAVLNLLGESTETMPSRQPGGFSKIFGLMFFLLPIMLSIKFSLKRIKLMSIKKKLKAGEAKLAKELEGNNN